VAKTPRASDSFRKRLNAFKRSARHIDRGDMKAVHWTRVASRRLRELLPVLGLDADSARKLSRRLKRVTKQLGVVRELDVSTLMLEELGRDPRYSSTALKEVSARIEDERLAAHGRLAARLPTEKLDRLARRLQRAVKQSEKANEDSRQRNPPRPAQIWLWTIRARATRRAADLRSAIELAGSVYVPERLHDVRIAVKRLRYAMELGAEARWLRAKRDLAALKAAQDLLGRLHDVEILIVRTRETQASLSPLTLTVWRGLDSLARELENECRALHARYMSDRTKLVEIADRIHDIKQLASLTTPRRAIV
jgi:CHAD domain-containing protein